MKSTRKPTEPQSGAGSVWQDRDARDEIESEMRDRMKQDSPTSQVADSNGDDVSVNIYIYLHLLRIIMVITRKLAMQFTWKQIWAFN